MCREWNWICVLGPCAYLLTERSYAAAPRAALNRTISNGSGWDCALACLAAIRFECESAVANMNRKMLLIYCDTNIH